MYRHLSRIPTRERLKYHWLEIKGFVDPSSRDLRYRFCVSPWTRCIFPSLWINKHMQFLVFILWWFSDQPVYGMCRHVWAPVYHLIAASQASHWVDTWEAQWPAQCKTASDMWMLRCMAFRIPHLSMRGVDSDGVGELFKPFRWRPRASCISALA
ncbi:hypothetical protein BDV11DRAFT_181175 [Aspergillus similis]